MPSVIKIIISIRTNWKLILRCYENDSILVLKRVLAAKLSLNYLNIYLFKNNISLKNNRTLQDYEINDGSCLELLVSAQN